MTQSSTATIMTLITPGFTDTILYNNTDKHADVFSATQTQLQLFTAKFEKQKKTSAAASVSSPHARPPALAVTVLTTEHTHIIL